MSLADDGVPPPTRMRRSNSLALKNYPKWRLVPRHASRPLGNRLVPAKLFYDGANETDAHSVARLKAAFPRLGLVLDLQNQDEAYSVEGTGVLRWRVPHESKKIPSRATMRAFGEAVERFTADPSNQDKLIAVHCHYGFNRTGFLCVSYLVEHQGWDVEDAMHEFAAVRPPGIKHQHFRNELRRRYAGRGSSRKWTGTGGSALLSPLRQVCCYAVLVGTIGALWAWSCRRGAWWLGRRRGR